jgi:hypothetical protein
MDVVNDVGIDRIELPGGSDHQGERGEVIDAAG